MGYKVRDVVSSAEDFTLWPEWIHLGTKQRARAVCIQRVATDSNKAVHILPVEIPQGSFAVYTAWYNKVQPVAGMWFVIDDQDEVSAWTARAFTDVYERLPKGSEVKEMAVNTGDRNVVHVDEEIFKGVLNALHRIIHQLVEYKPEDPEGMAVQAAMEASKEASEIYNLLRRGAPAWFNAAGEVRRNAVTSTGLLADESKGEAK